MAILQPGQVAYFKGKIGQVVVSKWRQLTVGRSVPKKSSKKASDIQLDQQSKFAMMTVFISRMGRAITLGYQNNAGNLTPYNTAVRYHLNNAVLGEYPNFSIDFAKVRVSQPRSAIEIDAPDTFAMGPEVAGKATITWTVRENSLNLSDATDTLYTVFYNATEKLFMLSPAEALRSALTANARVPQENGNDEIHGWMFFVSPNKKLVSRSVYLGIVQTA